MNTLTTAIRAATGTAIHAAIELATYRDQAAARLHRHLHAGLRDGREQGSGVVETIIIVAGFAGLAFVVYLAVSDKVHGWIDKIPGASGP